MLLNLIFVSLFYLAFGFNYILIFLSAAVSNTSILLVVQVMFSIYYVV